jgi:hypothetical protein
MIHDIQQFLPSLIAQPTAITTNHRGDYLFGHSLPTTIPGKLLRHPRNLVIVKLILSPILFIAGIHFPPILFSTTKVTPRFALIHCIFLVPTTPLAGILSLSFRSLFFPTRDLIASF